MKLCFDSLEELQTFYEATFGEDGPADVKKPRRGRPRKDEQPAMSAPDPVMPPAQQAPPPPMSFQAPAAAPQAAPVGAGPFGAAGALPAGPSPEVTALVQRISTRADGAVASGQPADAVLQWFRGQVGAGAENATMDQIKTVFLAKLPQATLEFIAKSMNA